MKIQLNFLKIDTVSDKLGLADSEADSDNDCDIDSDKLGEADYEAVSDKLGLADSEADSNIL